MNIASDYLKQMCTCQCAHESNVRLKTHTRKKRVHIGRKHMMGTYKCATTHGNVLVVHCMEKSKFVNKRLLTAIFSSSENLTMIHKKVKSGEVGTL